MRYITLLIWVFLMIACKQAEQTPENLKKETSALSNNLQDFFVRNSKDVFDNVYPIYNPEVADTKYNKERFKEFFNVPLTKDIKNIYAYYNQSEEEPVYLFSFDCNQTTADKIIASNNLLEIQKKLTLPLLPDFKWWAPKELENDQKYGLEQEEITQHFWYDSETNQAHYIKFAQ